MKTTQLYLVRAIFKDMILGGYYDGIRKTKNAVKNLIEKYNDGYLKKLEYGKAPCRDTNQWANWDKSTVVVAYEYEE